MPLQSETKKRYAYKTIAIPEIIDHEWQAYFSYVKKIPRQYDIKYSSLLSNELKYYIEKPMTYQLKILEKSIDLDNQGYFRLGENNHSIFEVLHKTRTDEKVKVKLNLDKRLTSKLKTTFDSEQLQGVLKKERLPLNNTSLFTYLVFAPMKASLMECSNCQSIMSDTRFLSFIKDRIKVECTTCGNIQRNTINNYPFYNIY